VRILTSDFSFGPALIINETNQPTLIIVATIERKTETIA
jgi:hypothetical protein